MARPTKTGLDYFPLDVGFLRDKKVRLLRTEFGASSVLFVLYVLGKVYEGDGYFLKWDKDEELIAADELRETPTYISEVLHGCLSRSLFDERVFQVFGVLTSAGIQRRYLRSCEKRDDITVFDEYWLLNVDDKKDVPAGIRAKLTFLQVSGGKNPVNSPGNPVDSPGNPESKVKESKVNTPYSPPRGRERTRFVPPTVEEVRAYCRERGNRIDPEEFVAFYASKGWKVGRNAMKDWKAAVITWEKKRAEESAGKETGIEQYF